MQTKKIGLILGPIAFLGTYFFASPEGLSESGTSLLAITFWIAIWWITEAIPIAATALLPLVIFPLTGVMGIKATSIPYSDPMVLLYMGGFMIAVSIEKWNLHKRIALQIISFLGTDLKKIILGFMVATAFLSMWISNTATSLMMLPIAIAVVMQVSQSNEAVQQTLGQSLMLGIAYSASIGGLATIIGTPTNVILVGVVKSTYGIEISFGEWMLIGFPIALGLLLICWYYLVNWAFHFPKTLKLRGGKEEIKRQLTELGPISRQEKRVLWVFIAVSFSWISRSFLLQQFVPALTDTIIALTGVLLLFVIPAGNDKKEQLLDWKVAEKIPWGILILFGGGLALAEGFQETGLANWIGEQFIQLQNFPFWLFLLLIIAAVNFLTEITSNVATASMLLPILAAVALAMGVHPYGLMIGATMAASCAFMLPVATPPNAVVFGSGYLTIPVMMRTGFFLNLLSIAFILMLILFYLPWIWNFNMLVFPEGWK
ncbi:solute carrier family 13 (sodium-dependent dicarboxylate transporter), member 2/3/5 [Cyclobacterium xiamenense]|uniref:Solute carrier family 13 (Sodium-dependent dicarboxylate transporter), member 2/3/5 n=1 Tax=Cyclobacterium xiamenense TaxID=1297121 RepID=A0A1H6UBU4_9BACT|nr:SLC13 family permease [Cyclobacterium xiamenense]SEI89828.1 solute carrier family 13 (sodium-dependent dicarboxylate transporter), member 2/3/5 [Cyclobacterium xiamenense]